MTTPRLVVFDLDGTLVNSDSAQDWMQFLLNRSWPGSEKAAAVCSTIMQDYSSGKMNMQQYMQAWLSPIADMPVAAIHALAVEFAEQHIKPRIFAQGRNKVQSHQEQGDILLLISASPTLIVKPISHLFAIRHVIGINVKVCDSRITRTLIEPLSFKSGKLENLQQWQKQNQLQHLPLDSIYSDSINDLALFDTAINCHVVNGNEQMLALAHKNGWEVHEWVA